MLNLNKSTMKKDFIGIDISKKKLDVWIHSTQTHKIFENNSQGFTQMLQWVCKQLPDSSATVVCMEHTGKYDVSLCLFLQSETRVYYKVSALRVRRSMGIKRGKSDKVDARELARYAYLFQEELKGYQMPTPRLRNLKQLTGAQGQASAAACSTQGQPEGEPASLGSRRFTMGTAK